MCLRNLFKKNPTEVNSEIKYLIVGLGNPGEEYENTRHNAGFKVVDLLGDRHNARHWKSEGGAFTSAVEIDGVRVLVAKPQTFMNISGNAVANLLKLHKLTIKNVLIIHDELDIEADDVRFKMGGGHAGHNGLRSIHDKLQTNNYARVRVGIGRPPGRMQAADYVLAQMRPNVAEELEVSVAQAADMVEELVVKGLR